MRISLSACNQVQPLVNFPGGSINMDQLILPRQRRKDKVVVVIGATGTGKSRLSIDLATRYDAEVINSDKMQIYKGLDIVTNKVTDEERRGVPHNLLGFVPPDEDFTAEDFVHHASLAADRITRRGRLPIIVGGSNSYVKALVNDDIEFRNKYELCFLWVDVLMPILHSFVSKRVDRMVDGRLVDEVKEFFVPLGDYSRGIRRAIGVPEMHDYFINEPLFHDDETRVKYLEEAIQQIKSNTCILACRQLKNILRLGALLEWRMHRLDATEAFLKRGDEADEVWERSVAKPSTKIVDRFLSRTNFTSAMSPHRMAMAPVSSILLGSTTVATAATH
ncbi:Isopentenyltransferase 5 [Dorcoceras hygrometricum]|uniref:adenylate dimethylallyltransferase (ADP/ATP-dependent) n=1 Tax=Dorcoceras hygrometricum TaxID=472368 RepID=A0A2Z7DAE7_9LAMI|nr:Isopentenyltransferase 5 [Dorcoceras hygrometricum]